jgi:hypothetical protein
VVVPGELETARCGLADACGAILFKTDQQVAGFVGRVARSREGALERQFKEKCFCLHQRRSPCLCDHVASLKRVATKSLL